VSTLLFGSPTVRQGGGAAGALLHVL
jgi:hypothetical protein